MNISYVVNARIPTEKAHGFQIMKVCEELSRQGAKVELVVPRRRSVISKDAFLYYGIERRFLIRTIGFDVFRLQWLFGRMTYGLQSVVFIFSLLTYAPDKGTVIYTRNADICWLFRARGYKTVYNAHNWPNAHHGLFQFLTRAASGVVCNSFGTAREFTTHNYPNVLVAPNGADVDTFKVIIDSKAELRRQLGLPVDKKIAMYVGHLYGWKGVDVVLVAAKEAQNRDDFFVLVGGTPEDVKRYQQHCQQEGLRNVLVVGHKEREIIPNYLLSADALLLPNIPTSKESESYTSPIKMFEYMASGVPIIASDLPSIREVLDESTAYMVKSGDHEAILRAFGEIDRENSDPLVLKKTLRAKERVMEYTWDKHVQKILDFFQTLG